MNLLGSALYDPAVAVSKATSSLLALTALDTSNLRLAVTVPAHGKVRFRLRCAIVGATTPPVLLLGVLNSATVVGRVTPLYTPVTAPVATQIFVADAEFTATGLAAGSTNFDAAYAVQVVVASTNIKYGGPNTNGGANAWGGFVFEAWDPQPLTAALDGAVNVKQWNGGAVPAPNVTGVPIVDDKYLLGTIYSTPATAGIQDINVKNMNNISGSAITTVKAVQGLAVDGVITTLTNLPAITANWLTAAGIAASALNGKGDWNIGKTGYALSAAGVQAIWDALTSALTTVSSIGKKLADWTIGTTQTGDSFARLGAPAGASVSADIASIKTDTGTTIPGRLPAALVSGRMDSSVGAMAANVLTATAINADAITDAKVAADVTIASVTGAVGSVTGAVGSVTGNVGGNVTGSVGSITGVTFPTNFSSLVIDATGRVNAFLIGILTTVFTEGAAGRIAAAFKQFFNIATPAATMDHGVLVDTVTTYTGNTVQTGDSFARIGAAGVGLTNLGDTRIAHLDADVSSRSTFAGGAVASVTGNVGGNVVGSVASVTAGVTVTTNNDKTGYGLSAASVQAVWDALTSALTTSGSIGKWIVDKLDVVLSTRLATTGYTAPDNTDIVAIRAKTDNLPASPAATGDIPSAASIRSEIDANSTKLDAAVSTRLAGGSYTAPDNTSVAAIKTQTDQLAFTVANQLDVNVQSVNDTEVAGDGNPGSEWGPV